MENLSLQEIVKKYINARLKIFPLLGKYPHPNQKGKNWRETPYRVSLPKEVKNVDSIGLVIPEDYIIIDVDPRNFENKKDSLEILSKDCDFNFLQNAKVKIKTANDGWHLYYKKPKEIKLPNSIKKYSGIDFKQYGGYVVIGGSKLQDGKSYKVENLNFDSLNELDNKVLNKLITSRSNFIKNKAQDDNNILEVQDCEIDINLFKGFLENYSPIDQGSRNSEIYKIACNAKNYNLSKDTAFNIISGWIINNCKPPLSKPELKEVIEHAYFYSKGKLGQKSILDTFPALEKIAGNNWFRSLKINKKGEIRSKEYSSHNVLILLQNLEKFKNKLAYNEFDQREVWIGKPPKWKTELLEGWQRNGVAVTDEDFIQIKYIFTGFSFDISTNQIAEAIDYICSKNPFHPVKDYFCKLPNWDGKKRLERFFADYCNSEDNKYSSAIGKKIFVAAIARTYNPGCKFDYLPIFIGSQGRRKSQLIETLAIDPSWYAELFKESSIKDTISQMGSKLILENSELAINGKKDLESFKAFISRKVDRVRLPYAKKAVDLPRRSIMIATTNEDSFLNDTTGNRRMWVIRLNEINLEKVKEDLDQLYAEALILYKNHEPLYLEDESVVKISETKHEESFIIDEWEEEIGKWLKSKNNSRTTGAEIWQECFTKDIADFDLKYQRRISQILKHLGWVKKTIRLDGKVISGFEKNQKSK